MPPRAGRIVRYDWYLGGSDYKFEPAIRLPAPQTRATVRSTVSFPEPGEYVVTLRTAGERNKIGDAASSTTPLFNLDRVRVVVTGQSSLAGSVASSTLLSPDFWYVDVARSGTQCVVDPRNVGLGRADASRPARLRAFGPANSPSTIVEIAQGQAIAPLDPATFPILDGSTMTVADNATGATLGQIAFAILPSRSPDPKSLAQALQSRGCTAQLEGLNRSRP
jgi:hypothetical protein